MWTGALLPSPNTDVVNLKLYVMWIHLKVSSFGDMHYDSYTIADSTVRLLVLTKRRMPTVPE